MSVVDYFHRCFAFVKEGEEPPISGHDQMADEVDAARIALQLRGEWTGELEVTMCDLLEAETSIQGEMFNKHQLYNFALCAYRFGMAMQRAGARPAQVGAKRAVKANCHLATVRRKPRPRARKVDHGKFYADVQSEIAAGRTKSHAITIVAERHGISGRAGRDICKEFSK